MVPLRRFPARPSNPLGGDEARPGGHPRGRAGDPELGEGPRGDEIRRGREAPRRELLDLHLRRDRDRLHGHRRRERAQLPVSRAGVRERGLVSVRRRGPRRGRPGGQHRPAGRRRLSRRRRRDCPELVARPGGGVLCGCRATPQRSVPHLLVWGHLDFLHRRRPRQRDRAPLPGAGKGRRAVEPVRPRLARDAALVHASLRQR